MRIVLGVFRIQRILARQWIHVFRTWHADIIFRPLYLADCCSLACRVHGIFWETLLETFPYPALSGLTVDTWLRQFTRLWYFTHFQRECGLGLWIFCEILPEVFTHFALFGLTVDTHFFKVVFMPVVMLDRRLVRTVPKPVMVPQVQFLAVVLMPVLA